MDPNLPGLTGLHLVGDVLQEPLSLAGFHGASREHLQGVLQPSAGLMRQQLKEGHHDPRRIGEAVPGEGEHHARQYTLSQELALRGKETLDGLTDLGWVHVGLAFGASKFRNHWFVKCKAKQIPVVMERSNQGINLLQGEGAESGGEDGDGQGRADAFLGVVADGVG